MERFLEVAGAVLLLLFLHWGLQEGTRRAGKSIARGLGKMLRPGLRRGLTWKYRRKAVAQMREQRKKAGVPPLENPHLE
jgi:hypothetical protein